MNRHVALIRVAGIGALSLIFILLWSSGWTASDMVVSHANMLSVLSVRYIIVLLVLILTITLLRQWRAMPSGEIQHHLLIGVFCHAFYLLGSLGAFELGVSATVVAFINSLQPMATAALVAPTIGEQLRSRHLKGLFLGIVSVALIVSNSYQAGIHSFALVLPFIAMMSITLGTVLHSRWEMLHKRPVNRRSPVLLVLLVQIIGALIVFLPTAALTGNLQWQFSINEWGLVIWLALAVSLGAYAAMLLLLRYLSAIRVSSLTYLVPPATMFQMYYLLDEPLSLTSMIALCVACVAVYLIVTPLRSTIASTVSAQLARQRLNRLGKRRSAVVDIELA